jgi:DNA polymerase-3 subunit chi
MTRIDFHSNVPDKIAYACRLTRKAYMAGNRVLLLADDATQLAALDTALWTFSAPDFLPHVLAGDALAPQTPIVLSDSDAAEPPHCELLVNLSRRLPAHFARFGRLIEIVSTDADDAATARQRYTDYKRQAYQPTHFVVGKA